MKMEILSRCHLTIADHVIQLLLILWSISTVQPACTPGVCGDHGRCEELAGDDFLCVCHKGWIGTTCTKNACDYMRHSVVFGQKTTAIAVNVTSDSLYECEELCANRFCEYWPAADQCRLLAGTSINDFTFIDDENSIFLYNCDDCFSYAPEPLWLPSGHTSACWRDETHYKATLTCNPGSIWSDTLTTTKVEQCDCSSTWPSQDLGTCIVGTEAPALPTTAFLEPETTTEIFELAVPETTTEIAEPATTDVTEPETATEVTEPETTVGVTEPETTTEVTEPETTVGVTEAGTTNETAEPATTEFTEPETATKATEPETTVGVTDESTTHITETEIATFTQLQTKTETIDIHSTVDLNEVDTTIAITLKNQAHQIIPGPCLDPPFPPNMDVWYSRLVSGAVEVYYKCQPSYKFPTDYYKDEYMLVCSKETWEGLPVPDCIFADCPNNPIDHASVSMPALFVNTVIEVTCDSGFHMPDNTGSRSLVCVKDETWNSELHACQEEICPAFEPQHTKMIPKSITQNSIVTIQCPGDTLLTNGRSRHTVECSKKGKWNEDIVCADTQCPPAPYLENALVNTTAGDLVYTCLVGYKFANGDSAVNLSCTEAIDVIGRLPYVCLDITCPVPPSVGNATQNTSMALYGTHLKYECHYGYWFPDKSLEKVITCGLNGTWSMTDLEDCTVTICDSLSAYNNVTLSSSNQSVGSVVEMACSKNSLRFIDGSQSKTVTCLMDGSWDDDLVSHCSDNRCNAIPHVPYSTVNTKIAVFHTVVTYTCLHGYEFQNGHHEVSIICDQTTQAWNSSVSACQAIMCSDVPFIPHANPTNNSTVFNNSINITCEEGYVFPNGEDSLSARCLLDQTWQLSENYTQCIAVFCPEVEQTNNRTTSPNFRRYGSELHIACIPGYEFQGTSENEMHVRCESSAQWNTSILPCIRKQCSPVPTWLGLVIVSESVLAPWAFGDQLNYTCAEGFRFGDDASHKTALCTMEGMWDPALAECIETTPSFQSSLQATEAPGAEHFLAIAVSCVLVVIVTVFVLDIVSIKAEVRRLLQKITGHGTKTTKVIIVVEFVPAVPDLALERPKKVRKRPSRVKAWKAGTPINQTQSNPSNNTLQVENKTSVCSSSRKGSVLLVEHLDVFNDSDSDTSTLNRSTSSRGLSTSSTEEVRDASPRDVHIENETD